PCPALRDMASMNEYTHRIPELFVTTLDMRWVYYPDLQHSHSGSRRMRVLRKLPARPSIDSNWPQRDSPMPSSSLTTSSPCIAPTAPTHAPSTPASWQPRSSSGAPLTKQR